LTKKLVREAYDIWGQSMGFVVATVPDDFDLTRAPLPQDAPRELFSTSRDAMRAIGINPPEPAG
jgi:hypothetical protein